MDSSDIDYLQALIGQPWDRKGLHCWELVTRIQRDLFGREVPFGPASCPPRKTRRKLLGRDCTDYGWREVGHPVHGAVVRMHRIGGKRTDLEHAGVYVDVDEGLVIHTDEPHGVVADSLIELSARGWVPRYFMPKG